MGDNVAFSCGCVLTRAWVNEFLAILVLVPLLSHPAQSVFSLGPMYTHAHDLCTFSSHGPFTTLAVTHSCLIDPNSFVLWKTPRKWCPVFHSVTGVDRLLTTGLFLAGDYDSGLGTDVHFSGDESGMQ